MKDTKMVRVVSRGFVTTSRGRVIAPIMSPYRESVSRIWSMITVDRADVEEKLPDGTFLKLTPQNFDKDNFVSKEKKEFVKPELQEIEPPVETFKNTDGQQGVPEENSQETHDTTVTVNGQKRVDPRFNKKNKGKNRNNNNQNGNNQSVAVDAEPVQ